VKIQIIIGLKKKYYKLLINSSSASLTGKEGRKKEGRKKERKGGG
jgi:hypothetical protein